MFDNFAKFEYKDLPNTNALYGIFKDDILLYIGSTFGLRTRMSVHFSDERFQEADKICYKLYDNYSIHTLKHDELSAIRREKPLFNKGMNGRTLKRNRVWFEKYRYYENRLLLDTQIREAFDALWKHIEFSNSKINTIRKIADELDISFSKLYDFSKGYHKNFSPELIVKVYKYLIDKEVEIDPELLITQPTGQQRTDTIYNELMKYNIENPDKRVMYAYNRTVARLVEFCAELERELNVVLKSL